MLIYQVGRSFIQLHTFMQYITWISNNQTAWTLKAAALGADASVHISARPVAEEPMVCFLL